MIPAYITVRAWRTCRDACRDPQPAVAGKTFPAFPAHAQPAIVCIWQEAHSISYPLFADADTGIYPHAASQYHARPKEAKRGIAMLSVDKFPYPRKQTRGNEFIPYSNNIRDILKRFRSFKTQLSH